MKKSLSILLALVFVLSIAGTALAAPANPFVDVPAKHWAYDAVSTLAKAGIVDGYGDGTFRGDRTMTRYEMAQIVAKAMAKSDKADAANKALIDKLAVEFAAELNNLGVRVSKVEAKQNIWFKGDARLRYVGDNPDSWNGNGRKLRGSDSFQARVRLMPMAQINDNISFAGRIQAQSSFGQNSTSNLANTLSVDLAAFNVNNFLGIDKIRAGRWVYDSFGAAGVFGKAVGVDGVTVWEKFGSIQFAGTVNNVADSRTTTTASSTGLATGVNGDANTVSTVQLSGKIADSILLRGGYYWGDSPGTSLSSAGGNSGVVVGSTLPATSTKLYDRNKGYLVGFNIDFGGIKLLGDYVGTTLVNPTAGISSSSKAYGFMFSNAKVFNAYYPAVNIVDVTKPGTDAWAVGYYVFGIGSVPYGVRGWDSTFVSPGSMSWDPNSVNDNSKILYFAYQTVLAKNAIMTFEYKEVKIKDRSYVPSSWTGNIDKDYTVKFEFYF
jgi:hypothetical protein